MTAITEDMTTDQAFEVWLQNLTKNALLCRIGGHRLPDWGDKKTRAYGRNGTIHIEADCLRKCGCTITTFISSEGYIEKQRKLHWYDKRVTYLLPPEARNGMGLTKEMRARMRREFLIRNTEWITQED